MLDTRWSRIRTHRAAALAIAALWLLWMPKTAWAHAAIVSSQPAPDARLSATPGLVVLEFSEPLNDELSNAMVTDPIGQIFHSQPAGELELRVPLSTNAPGIYRVQWTAVSAGDGHTLRGSFEFGVGVASAGPSKGTVRSSPRATDLAISLGRAAEYAALLIAVGMLLLRRIARGQQDLEWVRFRLPWPLAVAFISGVAVVLGETVLAAPHPSISSAWTYLSGGLPGIARLLRVGLEAVAFGAAIWGSPVLWAWVAASVVALAAAGHAAAIRPAWWGITVDASHLLTSGLWAGGILALALLRPPGGWRSASGRRLLSLFSPAALAAFALTVGFGVVQAFLELGGLHPLVATSYGLALLAKAALVATMVPLSLRAWRRRPVLRMEAMVAIFVIGAAAILAAYPLPPRGLQAAEAARRRAEGLMAHPRPGDLTLGSNAGHTLVGLSLRPGFPGENQVLLYLLPLAGEEAAASAPVDLAVDGRPSALATCGSTCRRADLELRGGESITVRVGGPDGGSASFAIPGLPAPDGTRILELANERLHQLSSYRVDETFLSGPSPIRSRYEFLQPNRMKLEVAHAPREVWIGQTIYSREADGSWKKDGTPSPLVVPFFIWQYFRPVVAPRIVGTEGLGRVLMTVVSFAIGGAGDPIWFRLWVDPSGLVREAQMRAPGHFMDHRYSRFDRTLTINPPVGPSP